MKHTKKLIIGAVLAAFASTAVFAADSVATAKVQWNSTAAKKTDVELNVFASTDALTFKWNPSTKAFTTPTSDLTIQAAGRAGSTAYSITTQLVDVTLVHEGGAAKGVLNVSAELGALDIGKTPVNILNGDAGGVKTSIAGLNNMDLAKAGPNVTPKGTYHEATGIPVKFKIFTASKGNSSIDLDAVEDGTYSGVVSMSFVAKWADTAVSG